MRRCRCRYSPKVESFSLIPHWSCQPPETVVFDIPPALGFHTTHVLMRGRIWWNYKFFQSIKIQSWRESTVWPDWCCPCGGLSKQPHYETGMEPPHQGISSDDINIRIYIERIDICGFWRGEFFTVKQLADLNQYGQYWLWMQRNTFPERSSSWFAYNPHRGRRLCFIL